MQDLRLADFLRVRLCVCTNRAGRIVSSKQMLFSFMAMWTGNSAFFKTLLLHCRSGAVMFQNFFIRGF